MRFIALSILLCMMSPIASAVGETVEGPFWSGTMDAGARVFRFRIEAATDANGSTAQQLVSLDEGNQVFRLDDFQLNDAHLTFSLKVSKATYAGELSDGGTTSVGKWTQAGKDFDLVLHKVAAVPIDQPAGAALRGGQCRDRL